MLIVFWMASLRVMIGFAPGHAYLGGLDAKLAVPRRASPRASVPAGSVAIANRQAVVYPFAISARTAGRLGRRHPFEG